MSYCSENQDVTLYYKFGGSPSLSAIKFKGTIDVTVTNPDAPSGATSNYNARGYGITWFSPNNNRYFSDIVLDYNIVYLPQYGVYEIRIQRCDEPSLRTSGVEVTPSSVVIDNTRYCPGAQVTSPRDKISVFQKGTLVWSAVGNRSAAYNVVCGGGCPPGWGKCHSDSYPGYCCCDCESVGKRIEHITAIARSKAHG